MLDLSRLKTYPLAQRRNLVHFDQLIHPGAPRPDFQHPDLDAVIERLVAARRRARPVIWMMGAHVIKSGLSPLLVDLMERGLITHLAGNGAVSIHDFELCLIGETSEDVPHGLEDGSFGMAEETSAWMHRALRAGLRAGLGYGAAIGRFIAENPALFPYRQVGLLYTAYRLGLPATIHVTLGADIIHQHPSADFAILGAASGIDFKRFIASVSELSGGVFLNFGSAVTGPEVFLKALTIVRNLGYPVFDLTTANFDLRPMPDRRLPVDDTQPDYYYRPRKNVVIRPTARGGQGFHIAADHKLTIPLLHHRLVEILVRIDPPAPPALVPPPPPILQALAARQPLLAPLLPSLQQAFELIRRCLNAGGTLFVAGNGGSMADALHLSAELLKSFARPRPLSPSLLKKLAEQPDGDLLARNLQTGLRAVVLGANLSLSSAVANDMPDRDLGVAQELLALARPGDVFLAISTSGSARNLLLAAQTARSLGVSVIALTGSPGGRLAQACTDGDIALRVPAQATARVQELHIQCYHALCELLEDDLLAAAQSAADLRDDNSGKGGLPPDHRCGTDHRPGSEP